MPHCEYNVLYDKEDIILQCTEKNDRYPFVNLPLPYSYSALEPYIDTETMRLHHDAHLGTYIKNLNAALAGEASARPRRGVAPRAIRGGCTPGKSRLGAVSYAHACANN